MIGLIFALGLLVGFLAGIALDDALDLYRQSRKARPMTRVRPPSSRAFWTVILALAVLFQLLVGGLLIKTRADNADYSACTSRWQQEFAASYRARVESSTDASNALENVVRAVDSENPATFRSAVDDYLRLRDKQIDDQKKNPYPPLPDELCGETP